jgi:hypothetical protein
MAAPSPSRRKPIAEAAASLVRSDFDRPGSEDTH